jgi:hypothetical protein
MKNILKKAAICFALLLASLLPVAGSAYADTTEVGTYGGGTYGSCTYGTCTITLTSGGSTTLNVAPSGSGKCTVHSDTATVETGSAAGYTLTMTTNSASNAMTGSSGTIPALSATPGSPAVLTMNKWGYRVDGVAGFGGGPTSTQDSAGIPGVTFAAVPNNTQAGASVASSSVAAEPAIDTTVWYGLCADATQAAGTYTATVLYTAVAN